MAKEQIEPYFKSVKLQGMFISITLTKHPKASIDDFLKAIKEKMGGLIVFVKCPKCGVSAMMIHRLNKGSPRGRRRRGGGPPEQ